MRSNERVYVVDDDPAVLDALRLYLGINHFNVVCCNSGEEFLDVYDMEYPCCLILDMNLPDLSGLELQKMLAAGQIHIPIIFISGVGDVEHAVLAIKRGADDFLEKPVELDVLLHRVHEGLSSDIVRHKHECNRKEILQSYQCLTSLG